ncbi:MAG TPA: BON domain-containing protein [Pirellulales bacterium]
MIRTLLLTAACGLLCVAEANAQSRSLTSSSANGGTLSPGTRTLTGSSSGSSSGTGTSADAQTDAGSLSGSERFLRENRQGAFVGADAGDTTQLRSQTATTGTTGGGLGGRAGGRGGRDLLSAFAEQEFRANANNGGLGASSQPVLRRTIAADFEYPAVSEEGTEYALNARLVEVATLRRFAGALEVHVAGRTAVVEGVVATDREKKLAENLLRLEPGVSQVVNRIVVSSTLPAPTE